jgi:hypothetical protein
MHRVYPFARDRFVRFDFGDLITEYKHLLLTETDLGIPIDLIDPDAYKPPAKSTLQRFFSLSAAPVICGNKKVKKKKSLFFFFFAEIALAPEDKALIEKVSISTRGLKKRYVAGYIFFVREKYNLLYRFFLKGIYSSSTVIVT